MKQLSGMRAAYCVPFKSDYRRSNMPKFILKNGGHAEGGGGNTRTYNPGDVVESKSDLEKLFGKQNFERVPDKTPASSGSNIHTASPDGVMQAGPPEASSAADKALEAAKWAEEDTPTPVAVPAAPEGEVTEGEEVVASDGTVDLGTDVTEKFPSAVENDFLVFHKGNNYNVVDKDNPTVVVNKKHLKKKEDVNELIESFLAK
jgi:hypothetical protein